MKTQKAQWIAENLKPGEHYAGIILGKNGDPDHHVILLPVKDDKSMNWKAAQDMAKKAGGVLPSRCEQSLLFANCKEEFKPDWYWSGEEYAQNTAYAWCQVFDDGSQDTNHKGFNYCRARAVRRLVIE